MARKSFEVSLPAAADTFSTQEERDREEHGAVREIAIELMGPFSDRPYGVRDDGAMAELVSSIGEAGVLSPLLLRPAEERRYIIVSGHRRKHAAESLGLEKLPAYVRDMTDDEAVLAMADANLQRPEILPSEKVRSCKM